MKFANHAVEQRRGPRHEVDVAVGDRVERAGIDRDTRARAVACFAHAFSSSAAGRSLAKARAGR